MRPRFKGQIGLLKPRENIDFLRFFEKSEEKVKKMFDNLKRPEYNPDLCNANRLKIQAKISVVV